MNKAGPLFVAIIIFVAGFYGGYRFALPEPQALKEPVATLKREELQTYSFESDEVSDEQKRLRRELLRANQQISLLESRNMALAKQIDRMDLPLPGDTTYPELMQRIDRLPASLVQQQLRLIFDEAYLDNIEDPNEFAKELIEIALSDEQPESELRVDIEFSQSPVRGMRSFVSLDEVDSRDRIFAHFNASLSFANLILRWQHRASGEILYFGPLQLANSQGGYHSLFPPAGWRPGLYQVSVFDLDNERELVGSNSYQINSVTQENQSAEATGPDRDVIEDLISSGQAVSKSF